MRTRQHITEAFIWWDDAACRDADVEVFYSDVPERRAQALALCSGCPVREPCRIAALRAGEHFGIWGGQTETERRRELRRGAA